MANPELLIAPQSFNQGASSTNPQEAPFETAWKYCSSHRLSNASAITSPTWPKKSSGLQVAAASGILEITFD
jgi:hypothetical protein